MTQPYSKQAVQAQQSVDWYSPVQSTQHSNVGYNRDYTMGYNVGCILGLLTAISMALIHTMCRP